MKILLINPPILNKEVYAKYSAGAPCLPPLGLCYLGAVLLNNGYETKILDCVAEDIPVMGLRNEFEKFRPDLVGVTSATVSYAAAKKVLEAIKEIDASTVTVLGGTHISALPIQAMSECENIDIGVFGEGEYTLLEIVKKD